jgi:hypothetical protein
LIANRRGDAEEPGRGSTAGRRLRCLLLLAAFACLLAGLPAAAQAEVQTIDFDSAPPALETPFSGAGDISFPAQPGFRPYRTDVGARAHSGTTVGDLGRCAAEIEATGGEAGSCEFFTAHTRGVLARTAKSVTVFAGRFLPAQPGGDPEQATLTAFDAQGATLDSTGPVPIDASGFNQLLSVSDPAGRIASFSVRTVAGPGGEAAGSDLGIDDLAVNFADGGEPDFAVTTTNQVVPVVQGQSVEVPVQIPRLNGSSGPVELSLSGLPAGVSAAPVEVPGTQATAEITLVASPTAPDTNFNPTDATLVADPLGNANVGPAPRTTTLSVRVAADFTLRVNGLAPSFPASVQIEVPQCAPVEVPVTVSRDIALNQDISLSVGEGGALPAGVHAEILPNTAVPAGGDLVAHRTLRISVDSSASLPTSFPVEARVANAAKSSRVFVRLVPAPPGATVKSGSLGSGAAMTPRFFKGGSRVEIQGSGFCAGTLVDVGNLRAEVPASLVNDHTIAFTVPRLATSGPITIKPPGTKSYETAGSLTVDSFRNVDGFRFTNYPLDGVSFGELVEAFGADDLFVKINPCWPFGNCDVITGVPNPVSLIEWGMIETEFAAPTGKSGHCFAMDQASLKLLSGAVPYGRFKAEVGKSPPQSVHDLAGTEALNELQPAPPEPLDSFLDAMEARTNSQELVAAWVRRPKSIKSQLEVLAEEFSRNRPVDIGVAHGSLIHTVVAYDMTQTEDSADIYVYNSNKPFVREEEKPDGEFHQHAVEFNVIHVDKAHKRWTFDFSEEEQWSGEDDGTLWALHHGAVPENPSMLGVQAIGEALAYLQYGSDGTVRALTNPNLALLGAIASVDHPAAGTGTLVSRDVQRPLDATFEGLKAGTYSQAYVTPGFIASAPNVATGKGVRDRITGVDDSISVAGGESRPLKLKLARQSGPSSTTSATLDTHGSAGGRDQAGISADGAMTYAHDGAPTKLEFSLTSIRREGGPATFVSGPVAVGSGERLRAKPLDRSLRRVRVEIRGPHGGVRTRVLRNSARARVHIGIAAPRVSGRHLAVRFKLSGVRNPALVGATLRLMRGKRMVAHRAVALRIASGSRRIGWRLPHRVGDGRYRLLVDVRAIRASARASTAAGAASAHRAARVAIGG